jgi:hypothetical protein
MVSVGVLCTIIIINESEYYNNDDDDALDQSYSITVPVSSGTATTITTTVSRTFSECFSFFWRNKNYYYY